MILRFLLILIFIQNIQAHNVENMARIIGGHKAKPGTWPSIVSLNFFQNQKYQHHCGGSERPNLHFVGSAEPMPNRCQTLTNSFTIKLLIFQCNFFSLLSYMLKNQAEFLKLDSIH